MIQCSILFSIGAFFVLCAALLRTPYTVVFFLLGLGCLGFAGVLRKKNPANHFFPRHLFRTATGIIFILVFTLFLLELGTRLLIPDAQLGGVQIYVPHPHACWAFRPNTQGLRYILNDDATLKGYRVKTSAQGLRDAFFQKKEKGAIRIALLGDSFTEGTGLEMEETISAQLNQLLHEAFPTQKIEVMNCGCGGHGPWDERCMLEERVLPLEPDMVILQLMAGNDLPDQLIHHDNQLLRAYEPLNSLYKAIYIGSRTQWKMELEYSAQHVCKAYRFLFRKTQGRLALFRLLNFVRGTGPVSVPFPPSENRPYHAEMYLKKWYPKLESAMEMAKTDILAMQSLCAKKGTPFLAYTIPSTGMDDREWEKTTAAGGGAEKYERGKATRVFGEFFKAHDIPEIPVLDTLKKAAKEHQDFYYKLDGHFKPIGARLIAKQIAQFIQSHALLSPETASSSTQ